MPIQILDHIQLFINQYKKYWQMSYLRTLRDVTFEKRKMKTNFFDETKHIAYQIVKRTSQVITIFQFVIFSTDIK